MQIGYCPQFDALLEFLTVREHLELYARIKGVADYNMDDVCNRFLVSSVFVYSDALKYWDFSNSGYYYCIMWC